MPLATTVGLMKASVETCYTILVAWQTLTTAICPTGVLGTKACTAHLSRFLSFEEIKDLPAEISVSPRGRGHMRHEVHITLRIGVSHLQSLSDELRTE